MKYCGDSDCERGGCNGEARRLSISAAICDGGATKPVRPPRHKMNNCSISSGSYSLVNPAPPISGGSPRATLRLLTARNGCRHGSDLNNPSYLPSLSRGNGS